MARSVTVAMTSAVGMAITMCIAVSFAVSVSAFVAIVMIVVMIVVMAIATVTVMAMTVLLIPGALERRFDGSRHLFQDAIQAEGLGSEKFVQRNFPGVLGEAAASDGADCVQRSDGGFHLLQHMGGHSIHLVQEDLVCEGDLLRGLVHCTIRSFSA
mmetsp:Transcript_19596/g.45563  ORF Transcript_19596/g.45563 Transcript_19596/m.45563 type:complete len:156 (-) Transcript_19596:927-1394(-)